MTWEESTIQWTSRWDTYLDMSDVQIHWFSIINSVVVVFFLAGESHDYTSSLVRHSLLSNIVTAFVILIYVMIEYDSPVDLQRLQS